MREFVARARASLERTDGRVVVGIAGPPGAGRSTLAAALASALDPTGTRVARVPMDGFHLADVSLVAGRARADLGIDLDALQLEVAAP